MTGDRGDGTEWARLGMIATLLSLGVVAKVPLRDPEVTALKGRQLSRAPAALPMKDPTLRRRGKGE
jgi:hypothetical protein